MDVSANKRDCTRMGPLIVLERATHSQLFASIRGSVIPVDIRNSLANE